MAQYWLQIVAHFALQFNSQSFVFANPKTGLAYNSFYSSWNAARCRAGLPEFRVHDLRHSVASFLVNAGRSLYEVQELLGHSDSLRRCMARRCTPVITGEKPVPPPHAAKRHSKEIAAKHLITFMREPTYLFQCTILSLSSCYYPKYDQRRYKAPTHQHLWLHSACGLAVFDVLHVAFA